MLGGFYFQRTLERKNTDAEVWMHGWRLKGREICLCSDLSGMNMYLFDLPQCLECALLHSTLKLGIWSSRGLEEDLCGAHIILIDTLEISR